MKSSKESEDDILKVCVVCGYPEEPVGMFSEVPTCSDRREFSWTLLLASEIVQHADIPFYGFHCLDKDLKQGGYVDAVTNRGLGVTFTSLSSGSMHTGNIPAAEKESNSSDPRERYLRVADWPVQEGWIASSPFRRYQVLDGTSNLTVG